MKKLNMTSAQPGLTGSPSINRSRRTFLKQSAATADDGTLVIVSHGAAITLGLTSLLGLDANLGVSLNAGEKGGKQTTAFATVGGGF